MAKKKKGPFGKKGGGLYKGPGNFASSPATGGQKSTYNSYAGNKRRPFNRAADFDMDGSPQEQSAMMQQAQNTRKNTSHWDQSTRLRDKPIIFISAGFIEPAKQLQSIVQPKSESQPEDETQSITINNDDLLDVPDVPEAVPGAVPEQQPPVAQNSVTVQDIEDVLIEDVVIEDAEDAEVEVTKATPVSADRDGPDADFKPVEAAPVATTVEPVEVVEVVGVAMVIETVETVETVQTSKDDANTQAQDEEDEDLQYQFFEDVQGQDAQDIQEILNDAGAASDSSEEVILFKGRGAAKPAAARPAVARVSSVPEQAMRNINLGDKPEPSVQEKNSRPSPSQEATPATVVSAIPEPALAPSPPDATSPEADRLAHLIVNSDDDGGSDAVIDDYIDNMEADELAGMLKYLGGNRRTNRRVLGGTHNDIVVEDSNSSGDGSDQGDDESGEEDEEAYIRWDAEEHGIEGASTDSSDDHDDDHNLDDNWPLPDDIDDEELARLLAKQEELGMGTDELILFDETAASSKKGKKATRDAKEKRKRSKAAPAWKEMLNGSVRGPDGSFPSAEAVADAFDQLELMGKRGGFEFELSDSELETSLQNAWQKDRARKKEKKKAREEQRAQGLLGKFGNPDDPRVKYANGIEFEDLKTEFQLFLMGQEQTVALPPMDAHARKIIHEIAHRFCINSKSIGSGDQRRPSLVRKKGTLRYNESQFNGVFAKYRRRFFPRLDSKRGGPGPSNVASGRGSGGAAAQVRNGEVVGGSAPEIGTTNKGREMLEKMGWSKGMALGAMDNKGMTQPIQHVVKRSKAGLG